MFVEKKKMVKKKSQILTIHAILTLSVTSEKLPIYFKESSLREIFHFLSDTLENILKTLLTGIKYKNEHFIKVYDGLSYKRNVLSYFHNIGQTFKNVILGGPAAWPSG